jgi:hypothetical protein
MAPGGRCPPEGEAAMGEQMIGIVEQALREAGVPEPAPTHTTPPAGSRTRCWSA